MPNKFKIRAQVGRWPNHQEEPEMLLRACEGHTPCGPEGIKPAEKLYWVKGYRTSFQEKKIPLCDTCPQTLREDRHEVTEVEK